MAWLGEGLSTLKGQITSFTKEVLSEGREESYDSSSDFKATKKKVEELEALCASQDQEFLKTTNNLEKNTVLNFLEKPINHLHSEAVANLKREPKPTAQKILELRQRNAELQRQLVTTAAVSATKTHTEVEDLVDVELHCDGPSNGVYLHHQENGIHSINGFEASNSPNRELEEKTYQVERLKQELETLHSEKNFMNERCSHLEEQVTKLSEQLETTFKVRGSELKEVEELRSQLKAATEQLAETKDGNSRVVKQQLEVAEKRVEELEKELQKVHQQLLDHMNDAQTSGSESRETEQSRKQLLQDSGAQKTELLRARQDMVNRIIQMGEKSREVEMNVKKLQKEGKHLSADVTAIIHKLGDPEQQELIYDALNALELENQVLKLRNAQLEMSGCAETLKASSTDSSNKSDSVVIENTNKSDNNAHLELDTKSLEADTAKHQDAVEMKKEKQTPASFCTECAKLQKAVSDLNKTLADTQEEKHQLHQEKNALSSEIEAMAKIVQDLEAQLARALEENSNLSTNLEELDQQHQDNIDQILKVKQSLQTQNENLQTELAVVQKKLKAKEIEERENKAKRRKVKTTAVQVNQRIEVSEKELHTECFKHFEKNLAETFDKLITFEIPKEYYNVNNVTKENNHMLKLEALVKMCIEYRWKKDTLERKVAELMKELRESKDAFERRDMEANELTKECATLKRNVDSLIEELISKHGGGEGLAPIPENSEEIELLEQKIQLLENEIEVLKEARSNLEADGEKIREENQELLKRLQNATATMRNQENLEREVKKLQEAANASSERLQEVLHLQAVLEHESEELKNKVHMLEATVASHDEIEKVSKQRLQEVSQHETQLEEQVKSMQQKLQNAEEFEVSCNKKLKETELMKNAVKNLEEELKTEKCSNAELIKIIYQYEEELSKYTEEKKEALGVHNEFETLKIKYNETVNSLVDMEKMYKGVCEQLQEKVTEIENLKVSLQNVEEKLKMENSTSAELNSIIQQYKDKVSQYEEGNSEMQNELKLLVDKLGVTTNALCISEKKCEEAYAQLAYKDLELEKWKMTQDELEKQLTATIEAKNEVEQSYQNIVKLGLNLEDLESSVKEVDKWKQVAKTTERQLDEALQARAELEQECGRLFAVQSKFQNQEHLQQEVTRLTGLSESLEQQLDHLSKEKSDLEQNCEALIMELKNQQECTEELSKKCASLEEKLNNLISDKEKLQKDYEMSKVAEEQWKLHENKYIQQISEVQKELEEKTALCLTLEQKLKNVENEELLWKQNISDLEEKLKQVDQRKVHLEKEYQQVKAELEAYKVREEEVFAQSRRHSEMSDHMVISSLLDGAGGDSEKATELEERVQTMQSEKDNILAVLDEKTRENSILKAENKKLMEMIAEEKLSHSRLQEKYQAQFSEQSNMAKETIANLSKIIKDKDLEIDTLRQKCDSLLAIIQQTPENNGGIGNEDKQIMMNEITKLCSERDELIRTVKVKHNESVQYHSEIQRLGVILSEEIKKSEDLRKQLSDLAHQHEVKQRLLCEVQNELVCFNQNLEQAEETCKQGFTETSGGQNQETDPFLQQLHKNGLIESWEMKLKELIEKMNQCSSEAFSNHTMGSKVASENSKEVVTELTTPEEMKQKIEALQAECSRLADNLLQEQTRNKYLQNEVQEQYEKESSQLKELERLRQHLMAVEESYTHEAIKAEEQVQELKNKLTQAEERIKNSSTAYTSASIRANQHVESLQGQARLIVQQRDELQQKLSASEDQVQRHAAALRNLQAVLEQFQKDREREIVSATGKFQQELKMAEKQREELAAEISSLKIQLTEAKEALNAASRLGEELDRKSRLIENLKEEVLSLSNKLQEADLRAKSANLTVEGKVDRSLVKNLVLGYFIAPPNNKNEVLRIVATVLDFNQEERDRIGLEAGAAVGWLKSLLHPGKGQTSTQSLSEAFVRFLEQESRPQPQLRLLPEAGEIRGGSRSESPSSTASGSQRRSPLLLSEVQLPTFTQFPVSRSSSSILKDVLKES